MSASPGQNDPAASAALLAGWEAGEHDPPARPHVLQAAGQGSAAEIAHLLTSELATNVVNHAGTSFEVVVDITPAVIRIEIHDGQAVTEAFRDLVADPPLSVNAMQVGGRGLMLVGTHAVRFGLRDKGGEGKAIWFELAAS